MGRPKKSREAQEGREGGRDFRAPPLKGSTEGGVAQPRVSAYLTFYITPERVSVRHLCNDGACFGVAWQRETWEWLHEGV